MVELNKIRLYRMTHIDNIQHIIENGITHHLSVNRNENYKNIGDGTLINKRNEIILEDNTKLGDYIPFYFANRTPMLYVISRGFNNVKHIQQADIVYIVSNIQKMIDLNISFKFTDGHAVDGLTTFYEKESINQINTLLDWKAINSKYWNNENDLDCKRKKEAEFLVTGDINYELILGYIVYNQKVQEIIQLNDKNKQTIVKPEFYF